MKIFAPVLIVGLCGTFLASCASSGANYEPIIDSPRTPAYASDLSDCQRLAERKPLLGGDAANRALLGAGIGAAVGITRRGDDLENAAVGAGVGGAIGGASGVYDANVGREEIVRRCMSGRGYRVIG